MRIDEIVKVIPECGLIAEIGCDHAHLTERALKTGKAKAAAVSDISGNCLEKAKRTLRGCNNVTFTVCDGIPEGTNADCILICGMGGHTIRDILSKYDGSATLVLSPQSHAELVRETLERMNYSISVDYCFEDGGKYYDVMRAEKGVMTLDRMQRKYGRFYDCPTDALRLRLKRVLAQLSRSAAVNADRIAEITEVLSCRE